MPGLATAVLTGYLDAMVVTRVRRLLRAGLCSSGAAALLLCTSPGLAFCRTRTCGTDETPACTIDPASQCATNGTGLYWPQASFQVWVDPAGSAKRGITGQDARDLLERSLQAWTEAECGSGPPSITVSSVELMADEASVRAALEQPEGGSLSHPAFTTSVLTFVDEDWATLSQDAIALTTIFFGTQSGRIVGADIELDAADFELTLPNAPANFDLLSVLTHEAGHVLGLDHPPFPGPTMFGGYDGGGNLSLRSLESDDVAGICSIYPADRFAGSSGCGCKFRDPRSAGASVTALGFAIACVLRRRRRRLALAAPRHPET